MSPADLKAGSRALRKMIDATGYGDWVTDDNIADGARAVILAVDGIRALDVKPAPVMPPALPIPVRMAGD